ncbi:MAG: SH3 domain-containing protein [Hyphomicrobium sp.]|nr:SH3 domain-containing protein [Hyphomicrobium sp.]
MTTAARGGGASVPTVLRICVAAVAAAAMIILLPSLASAQAPAGGTTAGSVAAGVGPVTGLKLPRFVSLKSDKVNMRTGAGKDYPTQWVYQRAGLPLEVLNEIDNWRQVRDADGVTGWVSAHLLSSRRTALVLPWEVKSGQSPPQVPLRDDDSESARTVVFVEAGVIANVHSCDTRWCEVTAGNWRGYVEQLKLWGVYQNEEVK